jgi:hypothetical protein
MWTLFHHRVLFGSLALLLSLASPAVAESAKPEVPRKEEPSKAEPVQKPGPKEANPATAAVTTAGTPGADAKPAGTESKPKIAFAELTKDAKTIEGLIKLYRKNENLYAEFHPALLDTDFIILIAIARGIGETPLLGGMSWGFGDDGVWQFRKTEDRIQIVRRNVRFKAAKGSPQEKAVGLSYTDSVLFSLPIISVNPGGGDVVDLGQVFMSDLPQISSILRGFTFARDRSTWASVKGFKDNVEVQVAATYASGGQVTFDTVPDSRGVTINVHYSISKLPQTGYQPRLADDRVGYFLTVVKDFTDSTRQDRFVRYINRWDLRKAEPTAEQSPPKRPIVFWLEKTIPFEYRKPIREGILEWNKAFEKAGLLNAIEVRQQPDDADWDPEDVNYNTFRWITASAGFAMGPSRVNPTTGEILDADIIFDADFLSYWREDLEVAVPSAGADAPNALAVLPALADPAAPFRPAASRFGGCGCNLARGMARQLALGSAVLAPGAKPASKEDLKKLIVQGLKQTATHEVGHTLGLRHNFKGSALLTLDEINDPGKTAQVGLGASIMDYIPANFSPKGQKQGDYFSTTIGPYDYWAIEYGYKTLSGEAEAELPELRKIAARSAEPALNYATDEDTRPVDPDPLANRFDLGKDPIQFAQRRVELVNQLWPDLVGRMTGDGEGYQRVRRAFNILLAEYGSAMYFSARFVGGLYVNRDHKGDPGSRPPFAVVEAAKQREALATLEQNVFSENAFQFPPQLLNHLAPSKWSHWGVQEQERADFPVHAVVLFWQDRVLAQLLATTTLQRLTDTELKVPAEQDTLTAAELLERLTAAIFRETEKLDGGNYTNRKPAVSALRRSLQRRYLERLTALALGNVVAPEDCQTLAYTELERLEARIKRVLAGKVQLDGYTSAHLKETSARIRKVLDARVELRNP